MPRARLASATGDDRVAGATVRRHISVGRRRVVGAALNQARRCDSRRCEQSENNFLPNTGHQGRSCPSYRHEEPTSPGTCINLRTRRSQVRVLQGAPNQQLTAIDFRARTVVNNLFATAFRTAHRRRSRVRKSADSAPVASLNAGASGGGRGEGSHACPERVVSSADRFQLTIR